MRNFVVIAVLASVLLSAWSRGVHACAMPAPASQAGVVAMPHDGHDMAMPAAASDRLATPPCHEMPDAAPMTCCDDDQSPQVCGDCGCAAAGAQAGAVVSAQSAASVPAEARLIQRHGADPPDVPPGSLLRPPIVLS
jgi:hypothetical protein